MLWSSRQRLKREWKTALCGSQRERERNTPNGFLRLTGYLLWQCQRQGRENTDLGSLSLFSLFLSFFSCWASQKTSVNNVCDTKHLMSLKRVTQGNVLFAACMKNYSSFISFQPGILLPRFFSVSAFLSFFHLHTQQFLHYLHRN